MTIVCPKCSFSNPRELDHCQSCGAHLYLQCRDCGQINERAQTRCRACGHALRRTFWRQWSRKLTSRQTRIQLLKAAFVAGAILLLYLYISRLGNDSPFAPGAIQ